MAEVQAGSTVPRRQLGRYLRDLRDRAGMTVRAAAKQLERSEPTLWRVETGQVAVRSLDVKAMCELYGASAEMTAALMALAKETKAKGWWHTYGDVVPEWFDLYIGLEAAATRMDTYEAELIPGLLQAERYARTIIQQHNPDEDEAEIERRVQLRIGRQVILRRPIDPPVIRAVLSETILRRPVGGGDVMAEQLENLVQASERPNVSLRVVPFGASSHPGMLTGSFAVLRFPLNGGGEESEPPTVYSDLFTGALYLDKPHEVGRYDQAFEGICNAALDEKASQDRISQAAEAMRNG